MGTAITLSLNDIDIDWGKNRYWNNHCWLFPSGSLVDIEYRYAHGLVEGKPGLQTTLGEAYFRLCHLGYSHQETKTRFGDAMTRWNRTADLRLSFEQFHGALTGINFSALKSADLEPYIWDFRAFLANRLAAQSADEVELEEFVASLDLALILRVLADRIESRLLPLRWHYQDLVDSGWVSLDDLTEIDRPIFVTHHTRLFGRLQDYAGKNSVNKFDRWLADRGLPQVTRYTKMHPGGAVTHETTTLPTAVRNMIHHPENPHNALSDDDLRESVESLLKIVKLLPTPLPGLPGTPLSGQALDSGGAPEA